MQIESLLKIYAHNGESSSRPGRMNQARIWASQRLPLLFCVFCGVALQGQSGDGSMFGTVFDESGAVVPGVRVAAVHAETGRVRRVHTDDRGGYSVVGLPPGRYEVRAEMPGFRTERRTGLELGVAQNLALEFTLRVGEQVHLVVVDDTENSALVERRSPALGERVLSGQIRELPLNGRDLTELGLLQPGVVRSRGSTRDINVGFGTKVSVSGARPNQNLFVLDGVDGNDALNNTPAAATGQVTGVETVQEFRVLTSTMSAEYGRAAGGVFNIVTKSGSNLVHGSAFWFHRNDKLDARNFFDAAKPEFRRHQFGATLGGPLVRDKTFFFGSYEGLREEKGVSQIAFVPGKAIRESAPGTEIFFPKADRSAVLSAEVVLLLNLFPMPTGPEVVPGTHVEEFRGVLDRFGREDFVSIRIDHLLNDVSTLFGRYAYTDSEFLLPVLFPDFPNLTANRRQLISLGENHVLGPRMFNEFRFGFNRSTPSELVPSPSPELNLPLIAGRDLGSIRVTAGDGLPGLTEVGTDRTNPKLFFNNTFQLSDTLQVSRGRHLLKLGFLTQRFQFNGDSQSRTRGRLEFRSLIRLVEDDPRRIEGASANSDFSRGYRQSLFGFFVQDTFQIRSDLTLFAGLRWEFVTTPREVNGKVSNLTDFRDPGAGIMVAEERFAGIPGDVPVVCCRELFDNPTLGNLAPRIGLAWQVGGSNFTVLRAGFGIFHEQPLFHVYRNPIFRSLPFVERSRINADDWPGGPTVASLPLDGAIFSSPGGGQDTEAIQSDLNSTYSLQYNLNLQQSLGRNAVLTAAYVGSRGVNLMGRGDTNLAVPEFLPDGSSFFPNSDRRNQNFGRVLTNLQGFNSWYNAAQLGVVKRAGSGLTLQGAYTFSRCLDERSGSVGRQEQRFGQARTFDPFDRGSDKALCDFHVKHNLALNHLYKLPFGRKLTGVAGVLGKDWQVNGILNLASGVPFTAFVEGDPDGDGSDANGARPDLIGDPLQGSCPNGMPTGTPECWFNPTAFAFAPEGTRGNLGRNTLLGPGLALYDLAFLKLARIREGLQLELRAEFFNLFNRTNLNPPSNTEDGARVFAEDGALDPTGATISERSGTATSSREIQFGIRILF